jgi:nickel-dependent lactate racemase
MVHIDFAFGKEGLPLDLPDGFDYRVLEPRSAKPLTSPVQAIEQALDQPHGCAPLAELAKGKKTAAISVCDITRPVPNRVTLPLLLQRLEQAGIHRDAVTILIATGLHRPATEAEIREIVGEEIARSVRVVNHQARHLAEHRHLGSTASGTPVYIDERFVAADLRITLGFIEPHIMLGYSGGRKLIAPGLAAQETIKVLHSSRFMRDPLAHEGSIQANPLHHELLEIARMAHHDFLLDLTLGAGKPGERPITGVFAGDPVKAHAAGVEWISRVMLEKVAGQVDAVITTAAGYPLDLTFYQAIKGVTAASHIVRDGGTILLLAQCAEGTGAPEFTRMFSQMGDREFMAHIEQNPVEIDQWQLEKLAMVTRRVNVMWHVPGVPAELQGKVWGKTFATAEAAVDSLFTSLAPHAKVAVIPEGPYVLAQPE